MTEGDGAMTEFPELGAGAAKQADLIDIRYSPRRSFA